MPKLAFAFLFLLALAGLANAQHAEPDRPIERDDQSKGVPSAAGAGQQTSRADSTAQTAGSSSICAMIESAAVANDLPFEFFARVIWQESRLKPDAIGPVTRSGRQAQGIAQFMPMTAAERLLRDPFDPAQALPKSAEFLRELRAQFGNFGLAAAAYNAGPQRVRDWLAGKRTLPSETQAYARRDGSCRGGMDEAAGGNFECCRSRGHAVRPGGQAHRETPSSGQGIAG